jgi:hypothetical protein
VDGEFWPLVVDMGTPEKRVRKTGMAREEMREEMQRSELNSERVDECERGGMDCQGTGSSSSVAKGRCCVRRGRGRATAWLVGDAGGNTSVSSLPSLSV